MILKVIYRGFKSFADTVEVDFSKGLTTVIGPNGCGKSNIVDGIRWVLGEQSAKSLRGGKMEDVIFFGTTKRKPSESAEVTLVLDNSLNLFKNVNTPQVSVTRRTFRKGGSEYLVNGESVRLKDVQNLFLDSGIGSRSYSLIGQEQAKKILSTKIEERRAIFEEASGIVKFKQQKDQTEKRLSEIDSNLLRMDDILHELEGRVNPLKKQSEKATLYNEFSTELQTLEIQYLLNQYDVLKNEIVTLLSDIEQRTTHINQVENALLENDTLLEEMKTKYQNENEQIFSMQQTLSEKKEELDRISNEIKILQERKQNNEVKINEIESELNELETKHSLSIEEYERKKSRMDFVTSSIGSNQSTLEALNNQMNSVENDKLHLVNDYEHFRNKTIELYNNLSQKQYERKQTQEKEHDTKERLKTIDSEISNIKNEYESSKQEYKEAEHVYQNSISQKETLQNSLQEQESSLQTKQTSLETSQTQLQNIQSNIFSLKSKIENIESFLEKNDGFFDGVKAILQEKKKGSFSGVLGAFAELITVEEKYEVAIDTLLQSTMQSIVTTDEQVAKECIQFLNKGKLGRATFLPITMAQSTVFSKEELNKIHEYSGIHLALDAISYQKNISPVIESKLGRSLISDNLDIAIEFSKKTGIKTRISTVEGEILQSGSITGGSSNRQKANFFTKKRELEESKEQLEVSETTKHTLSQNVSELSEEIQQTKENVQNLTQEISQLQHTINEYYTSLKDAENNFQRYEDKYEDGMSKKEELTIFLKELSNKNIELKFTIETIEKEHKDATEKLENLHSQKENQDGNLTSMLKEMNETQTLLARLEEEQKQLNEYMESFGEDDKNIHSKVEHLKEKEKEESAMKEENQKQIEVLQAQYTSLLTNFEQEKTNVEEQRNKTQGSIDETNTLEKDIKTLRSEKETEDKELNKLNIKYSKKETELQSVLTRLQEDYELNEEQLIEFERQEIDMKNSKKQVDKLRKEIASLGNINHNAIEEYAELSTRFEEESKQYKDAKQAKKDLLELIGGIEEEMSTRFLATFKEIAHNFETTFVNLFEGGNAKLKLVDEKNPLTTEIEIIAQPPGKASKSISLLSGGEQSLAAVALIFAIILAKPSPFVILDEVDAPLDDANVDRFAKYLKKLSDTNQFIVITHRKGTKMVSDYMYGVTHEELGVSVVANVKWDFNEKIG